MSPWIILGVFEGQSGWIDIYQDCKLCWTFNIEIVKITYKKGNTCIETQTESALPLYPISRSSRLINNTFLKVIQNIRLSLKKKEDNSETFHPILCLCRSHAPPSWSLLVFWCFCVRSHHRCFTPVPDLGLTQSAVWSLTPAPTSSHVSAVCVCPEASLRPCSPSQPAGAVSQPDQGGGLLPGCQVLTLSPPHSSPPLSLSGSSGQASSHTRAASRSPWWTSPTPRPSSPAGRGSAWSSSSRSRSTWTWRPTCPSPTSRHRRLGRMWRKGFQSDCRTLRGKLCSFFLFCFLSWSS